jgi:uncharacterized protein involved in exopolysaccharide biosynthesis
MSRESGTSPPEGRHIVSTLDLLELIWRWKRLVAFSVVAALAAGGLYYYTSAEVFESTADVLLVQKRPEVVTRDQNYESGFEDYVSTNLAVIVSELIVERAIESASLHSLGTFSDIGPEEDLAAVIIGQLEATSGPRNLGDSADHIMMLSFQGPIPEDCPIVVNAVLEAYKAFLDEIYRDMSDNAMTLIDQARGLLQNDLQVQEDKYIQFRQQSPLVSRGVDEVNPLQDRLAAIQSQRSELLIRAA